MLTLLSFNFRYYRILACQQDAPSTASSGGPPADRSEMPNGFLEYLPNPKPYKPPENGTNDPSLLDFDDIARWTFEDWTFNPLELQQIDDMY